MVQVVVAILFTGSHLREAECPNPEILASLSKLQRYTHSNNITSYLFYILWSCCQYLTPLYNVQKFLRQKYPFAFVSSSLTEYSKILSSKWLNSKTVPGIIWVSFKISFLLIRVHESLCVWVNRTFFFWLLDSLLFYFFKEDKTLKISIKHFYREVISTKVMKTLSFLAKWFLKGK